MQCEARIGSLCDALEWLCFALLAFGFTFRLFNIKKMSVFVRMGWSMDMKSAV
jgi:hypothetical protein